MLISLIIYKISKKKKKKKKSWIPEINKFPCNVFFNSSAFLLNFILNYIIQSLGCWGGGSTCHLNYIPIVSNVINTSGIIKRSVSSNVYLSHERFTLGKNV